ASMTAASGAEASGVATSTGASAAALVSITRPPHATAARSESQRTEREKPTSSDPIDLRPASLEKTRRRVPYIRSRRAAWHRGTMGSCARIGMAVVPVLAALSLGCGRTEMWPVDLGENAPDASAGTAIDAAAPLLDATTDAPSDAYDGEPD